MRIEFLLFCPFSELLPGDEGAIQCGVLFIHLAATGKNCIFLKATRLVADAKVVLWTPRH
jgi:hypothetical protein